MIHPKTVTNLGSGGQVTLVVTGQLNGSAVIKASRIPVYSTATVCTATLASSNTYTVTTPYPWQLWYIWCADTDGASTDKVATSSLPTNKDGLTEVVDKLTDILTDNKLALDMISAEHAGSDQPGTIKQIVNGVGELGDKFPAIIVEGYTSNREFVGTDWFVKEDCQVKISANILHQDQGTESDRAAAIARMIRYLLSQPAYETFFTPSGLEIIFGQVSHIESTDSWYGDSYCATALCTWSGEFYFTDPSVG